MTTGLRAHLAAETGLGPRDLDRIIETAPRRYKVYRIPKRSGAGEREIAQPARELKMLQRIIVGHLLAALPVHSAAKAYRPGTSIADNARAHSGKLPILKMDFADFFPSIRAADWELFCLAHSLLSAEDLYISSRLLFRQAKGEHLLKLSIGAPSSPAVSNILMFEFDTAIYAEAGRRGISYTRYADDLTFSGQRAGMLRDMTAVVAQVSKRVPWPHLTVNKDKTTFVTTKYRRVVTGLTLTNDGKISIGRDRKREISSKIHHASLGRLSAEEERELSGLLAFANSVEPEFVGRLVAKYGNEAVARLVGIGGLERRKRRQPMIARLDDED